MEISEYQEGASKTALYNSEHKTTYPLIGLMSEVGEISSLIKRSMRDGTRPSNDDVKSELGDILWYLAMLSKDLGMSLDDVAKYNLDKLADRQRRGAIKGSGNNR